MTTTPAASAAPATAGRDPGIYPWLIAITGMLMTGVPAAAKRSLNTDEQRLLHQPAATYTELARVHRAQAEPLSRSRA